MKSVFLSYSSSDRKGSKKKKNCALGLKKENKAKDFRKREKEPLRKILNLWILIYDFSSGSIKSVAPDNDYYC